MAFSHKDKKYTAGPPGTENPFTKGQDAAYADILADKMRETKWWRGFVGTGILILTFVNFCFFVYAVSLQKTVPVLVNVMPSGEASYLGEVRRDAAFTVPESAIQFQARTFITNLRSVSTDSQVLYNNIDDCYAMVTASYEPVMTKMLRANSPFNLVGKARRSVSIESVIKITGSSYQIDWKETTTGDSPQGNTVKMRAIVTVKLITPTEQTIRKNPLGIYIDNCEMTEL
jgi:type IV secretion system protein VirB5